MANPITWQNVNAPNLADSLRPMESAQRSINSSFDTLGNLLKQREATDAANTVTEQQNAKLDYQTLMQGYTTPEQLNAPGVQEMLAQRLQALAPNVRGEVLGLQDARRTALQNQVLAGNDYTTKVRDTALEPVMAQGRMIMETGTPEEKAAFLKDNPNLPQGWMLAQQARTVDQGNKTFDLAQRTGNQTIANGVANSNLNNAQATDIPLARQDAQTKLHNEGIAKLMEQVTLATKALGATAAPNSGGAGVSGGSGGGKSEVGDILKAMVPDEATRFKVAQQLARITADPSNQYLTDEEKVSIAVGSVKPDGLWNKWFGDKPPTSEELLASLKKSPAYVQREATRVAAETAARENLGGLRATLQSANRNPAGAAPAGNVSAIDRAASAAATGGSRGIANAIFGQESGRGTADTSKTNSQGVTGPMQVKDTTFADMKRLGLIPKSYEHTNPEHNKDAGFKWVDYLNNKYDGDPAKVAAAYYGGEGAVNKDGSINRDWKNKERPNDPTVGQYVDQVIGRMGAAPASSPAAVVAPGAAVPAPNKPAVVPVKDAPKPETPAAAAARLERALLGKQAALEQDEVNAGVRKAVSPEVQKYLDKEIAARDKEDRKAIVGAVKTAGRGAEDVSAAFNDIFTLPVRGVMGAANTLLRVPNAFGANIPYIPDNGLLSSLTPYSDGIQQRRQASLNTPDLKARRAAFELEQKALREDLKKKSPVSDAAPAVTAPVPGQSPSSLPMDGLGNSPTPTKSLGAFEAPAPVSVPTIDAKGQTTTKVVKPETTHVALNLATGAAEPSKTPTKVPDVQWSQPVTVVKADPSVQSAGPKTKTVVTFAAEPGKVTGVSDGDGAYVKRADGSTINCRIDNINAPEVAHPKYSNKPAQPYGNEAKKTLEEMILNKEVTLRVSKEASAGNAKYGRASCQIEIEGKDVSTEMIRQGMAWLYGRYSKDPTLAALQATAKKNRVGLWGGVNPIDPETYSHMPWR